MSRITRPLSALAAFCLLAAALRWLFSMPAAATGQVRPDARLVPSAPLVQRPRTLTTSGRREQCAPTVYYTPQVEEPDERPQWLGVQP